MIRWPYQLLASKPDESCGEFRHEADACPGGGMLEYVAVKVALTHLKRWTVCSLLAYRNGNRCNRRSSSFELAFDAGNVLRKDHRVDMLAPWVKVPSALSSKFAVEPECVLFMPLVTHTSMADGPWHCPIK